MTKAVQAARRRAGLQMAASRRSRVREYVPDDDVRQVNWRATARLGRPMSNEQVLMLTDLLEEAAARSLVAAVPVLARRHAVAVASVLDPDVTGLSSAVPERPADAYAAAASLEVLAARDRTAGQIRAAGAELVEAQPDALAAAQVRAYLRAKARARL